MTGPGRVELPGVFGGHPGPVFALAYAPGGELLASGGWDGAIRLWDPGTGSTAAVLTGHAGAVRSLAFSTDGSALMSAGRDRTVRRWEPASGSHLSLPLRDLARTQWSVAFSPDGSLIAEVDAAGRVRLRDWADGSETARFDGPVSRVAFAPDGAGLACVELSGAIRIWDPARADQPAPVWRGGVGSTVTAMGYSADGALLAVADADGRVHLWRPADRTEAAALGEHTGEIVSLAFSPDGGQLAVGDVDGAVHLWDLATGAQVRSLPAHIGSVYALAYCPDGTRLASAGDDGAVRVQPLPVDGEPAVLAGHTSEILSAAYSPDGSLLATGDVDGVVRLWDTRSGSLAAAVNGDRGWVRSLAFSPDGTRLAAVVADTVQVWDAAAGFSRVVLRAQVGGEAMAVAFGRGAAGALPLACGTRAGGLSLWDARDGTRLDPGSARHGPTYTSLAFGPDGALTTASPDGLRQWTADLERSDLRRRVEGVDRIAFGPADGSLAGGCGTGEVLLWGPGPGTAPAVLPGHAGAVDALAYSPDGALVASGGDDGTVRLWDARAAVAVRTLTGHAGAVRAVAFAPDGLTLVSAGDDGRISEWSVRTGALVRGSGQVVRAMPPVPGLRSDHPSPDDLLGMADDVRVLATLIAATGTRPPLAIALLGEWGSGKSSIMLQVHRTVEQLASQSRALPGYSLFTGNVRQVRFNAWHLSDDQVWTGLVDHLFRTLAADADDEGPPPDPGTVDAAKDRLGRALAAKHGHLATLDRRALEARRLAAFRTAAWEDRWSLLAGALGAGISLGAQLFGRWLLALAGVPAGALQRGWLRGRSLWHNAGQLGNALDGAIAQTRREVADLEDRLARIDAAARLAVLLKRHGDADSYGGYRGLVGQVHHDLEELDRALAALRAEALTAGLGGPLPLERIVLYIDDLDRCPPARVVEVLAAVHLMLALPLFVVVVAVDPRWLVQALREHYGAQLAAEQPSAEPGGTPAGASALDYLDKIFQIPFAVRQPSPKDMGDFLLAMLGEGPPEPGRAEGGAGAGPLPGVGRPADRSTPVRPLPGQPAPGRAPSPPRGPLPRPAGGTGEAATDRPRPAAGASPEGALDPRPGGLILHSDEAAFMARLGPLLPTPRTAKKLANLYRLVRIGLAPAELAGFIGSGGYQPVQILLAVLVGTPVAVPAVFAAVRAAAPDADIVAVVRGAGGPAPAVCARIADVLAEVRQATPAAGLDTAAFQGWCPRLTRYSFHTLPGGPEPARPAP